MNICFSGTFEGYTKRQAGEIAATAGLNVVEDVTRSTHYLVSNKLDSAKTRKAKKYGIRVLTQSEFEEFVESGEFPTPNLIEPIHHNSIVWTKTPPKEARIEYANVNGEISEYKAISLATGSVKNRNNRMTKYLLIKTIDERTLTLREDRILSIA